MCCQYWYEKYKNPKQIIFYIINHLGKVFASQIFKEILKHFTIHLLSLIFSNYISLSKLRAYIPPSTGNTFEKHRTCFTTHQIFFFCFLPGYSLAFLFPPLNRAILALRLIRAVPSPKSANAKNSYQFQADILILPQ